MKSKNTLFNSKDVIAYFFVAATGALSQFVAGSFFRNYVEYTPSVALGYIVSFIIGFVLTKLFAFDARNSSKTRREMVKFGMVSFLSFWITVGGASLMNAIIGSFYPERHYQLPFSFIPQKYRDVNVNEALALLIAMGFSFASNYVLHKTFTFRSTGFYDRIKSKLPIKED